MPVVTKELIGPDQLSTLTGKSFTLKSVAGSKDFLLTPIATKGSGVLPPILLTSPVVEGLPMGTAKAGLAKAGTVAKAGGVVKAGTGAVAGTGVAKTAAAKGVLPTLVEIEGAGKVLGTGKSVTLGGLELNGILQTGGKGGGSILLQGGEAIVTQGAAPAKAAGTVLAKKGAAGGAGAVVGSVGVTPSAVATATKGAVAGTIWNGGGWSLGLGLGLGLWGPVLLAGVVTAAGMGVYGYMKKNKTQA
ncbi:MAG: hypothetical protein H7839_18835 [Magnetococcus sp. YQC-5]